MSQKHRAREAKGPKSTGIPDEASSVISSTFTLGDPINKGRDDESLDASVEEEFNQVVEGLQKTQVSTPTRPSPVKRPSNPAPHGDADKDREENSTTPTPPQPDPATMLQQCLFCRYVSPTIPLNAHHMERFHGMIIPEKDYLVDLEGLLKYLCSKIYEGFQCLSCGKSKSNAFAVQTHMRDVGHCTIPYTTEREQLEIGDFYDFRGTYSDGEDDEEDEDEQEVKKKIKQQPVVVDENGEQIDGEDDGWETDSSASSFDSEELTSVPADDRQAQYDRLGKTAHHSHNDPRAHHQPDGYHSHAHKSGARAVFYDDYELHLPSGRSVGHRSLNKYYRQNLQNYPTPEERAERLAIEEAEREEGADSEEGEAGEGREVARRDQQTRGALMPRGQRGIMGISDQKKHELRKEIHKSRDAGRKRAERRDLLVGQSHNNQKNYYYRYDGGG